jgi:hypothetical protein
MRQYGSPVAFRAAVVARLRAYAARGRRAGYGRAPAGGAGAVDGARSPRIWAITSAS